MQLEILGSGTSHGIPVIGCDCETCKSENPKDKRLRCSALITDNSSDAETPTNNGVAHSSGHIGDFYSPNTETTTNNGVAHLSGQSGNDRATSILIDVGPEFRIQALRSNIKHLDAVLLTHSHADHLHGIDDLRVFSCMRGKHDMKKSDTTPLKIYANKNTIKDFKYRFAYLFKPVKQGGGMAFVELINVEQFSKENPLVIKGVKIVPVPMMHGIIPTSGYVFQKDEKTIAYLTDCNAIPESSIKLLKSFGKIDVLVIDGLRVKPHSTHFSFAEALTEAEKIGSAKTYFTHLCHDTKHSEAEKWISDEKEKRGVNIIVAPAFDGLII